MIHDVLYAAASWLLIGVVIVGFFSRAAQRLRQVPSAAPELALIVQECRAHELGAFDREALTLALRGEDGAAAIRHR